MAGLSSSRPLTGLTSASPRRCRRAALRPRAPRRRRPARCADCESPASPRRTRSRPTGDTRSNFWLRPFGSTDVTMSRAVKSAGWSTPNVNTPPRRCRTPRGRESIVRVHDGDAVRREPGKELAFAGGHALERSEPFEMSGAGVGHEPDVRLGDRGEVRDFTPMVRAHLDDGVAMLRAQAEQRERDADVVVEIPFRDQAGSVPAQDRAEHFFRRRLSVAAGHRDHRARNRRRCSRAHAVNARNVSGTTTCGNAIGSWRSTSRPHAPRAAPRRELVAVEVSPRSAANIAPAGRLRRVGRDAVDDAILADELPLPQLASLASVSGVSESVCIRGAGLKVRRFLRRA